MKYIKLGRWQRLGEAIHSLIRGGDELNIKQFVCYKVKVNFNMLGTSMKARVNSHIGGTHVVTLKHKRMTKVNAKFIKNSLDPNYLYCSIG
jgi:hypothetical protein